jgi:hypothetical protein
MIRHELYLEVEEGIEQPQGELGRLDELDELFNALHGVGGVDAEMKELVLGIMHDLHHGGQVLSSLGTQQKKEMVVDILKIIKAALKNKPDTALTVLAEWLVELQTAAAAFEK